MCEQQRTCEKVSLDQVQSGWMTWEQIAPYQEQLIDMELDCMITYHYPDWKIPRSYPEQKVAELEQHLQSGNTFFWGVWQGTELLGFYWGYMTTFIDHLRWHTRSMYFVPKARGLGLGTQAHIEACRKAKALGCKDISTMYAAQNEVMAHNMAKLGFAVTRTETVRDLDSFEENDIGAREC